MTVNNGRNERVVSVSEIAANARFLLEETYSLIWIEGEVSNLRRPPSGHWYFTLKDDRAQIRCAMFANRKRFIRHDIADGMNIVIRGSLSLFEARGEFQAIVDHLEPAGEGALRAAFDELKTKLQAEGLFADELKRPLPRFPRKVAVISSMAGAAPRDVFSVMARRFAGVDVTLVPASVQGVEAERSLLRALNRVTRMDPPPDVTILTRGGGSLEDLWAFNAESIARRIAAFPIPIVSAIGHETDFTIADFVADKRAPTPSAAAEMITPDRGELATVLDSFEQAMITRLHWRIGRESSALAALSNRLIHPGRAIELKLGRVHELEHRSQRAVRNAHQRREERLRHAARVLGHHDPRAEIDSHKGRVETLAAALYRHTVQRLTRLSVHLQASSRALNAVSPLATLDRGYGIVAKPSAESRWGTPIASVASVQADDRIAIHVADGTIDANVTNTRPRDDA